MDDMDDMFGGCEAVMTVSSIESLYREATREELMSAYEQVAPDASDATVCDDTPLHLACSQADVQAVSLLLSRGARANTPNRYGDTPFHALAECDECMSAIQEDDVRRCAQLLMDYGADPRKIDDDGQSVIYTAATHGRYGVLSVLNERGVDMIDEERDGCNAFRVACEYAEHAERSMMCATEALNSLDIGASAESYIETQNRLEKCAYQVESFRRVIKLMSECMYSQGK